MEAGAQGGRPAVPPLLSWLTAAFGGLTMFFIRYARVIHDPRLVLLAPRLRLPPPFSWVYSGWALLVRWYKPLVMAALPLLWAALALVLLQRRRRRDARRAR